MGGWNCGKHLSEKHRRRIGSGNKGKKRSAEMNQRNSEIQRELYRSGKKAPHNKGQRKYNLPKICRFCDNCQIGYGNCHCGCGDRTPLAKFTNVSINVFYGEPSKYMPRHYNKIPLQRSYVVNGKTGCWIWGGAVNNGGYGVKRLNGKNMNAHRWVYQEIIGKMPSSLDLDHLCCNRICVNPFHMEPVSRTVNIQRGKASKLSPDDVIQIRKQYRKGVRGFGCRVIARKYGISPQMVLDIVKRKNWKNV